MPAVKKLVTNNLDIWLEAVEKKSSAGRGSSNKTKLYGVQKLRELILGLAVMGKLVPQDPNDEPASVLLEKIAKEKDKFIKENNIKKQKAILAISEEERPFHLPHGWRWVRLGDIGFTQTGGTPKKVNAHHYGSYVPFIKPGDIMGGQIVSYENDGLSQEGALNLDRISPSDSVLMVCIGTIGKCARVDRTVCFNQQINSVSPYIQIGKYVLKVLQASYFQRTAWESSSSTTIAILNKGKWKQIPFALAPEKEQHRIVVKVDELMALCDTLETQQGDAEQAHRQLVTTLLYTLSNSESAEDFKANWQRIAEHFDTLFTTEESIDSLKQTILQLAVMGKLVPQDPSDESVSVLQEKITKERDKLVKEGKIKKQKIIKDIVNNEIHYKLPKTWGWMKIGDLVRVMDAGWSPACKATPSSSESKWGVLKTTAVQTMKYVEGENKELPSNLDPKSQYEVKAGDILITRAGPKNRVGISCLVQNSRPKLMISDKIIRFHLIEIGISERFISLCLNAGVTASFLESAKSGMAESQMNISQAKLKDAPIPLCPIAEQHRIVAKVDELMAICDQLKSQIDQSQKLKVNLADALVQEAVS